MPRICDVSEIPVGGIYQLFNSQTKQPEGAKVTCLSKGERNGIGYNVIGHSPQGEICDMHFKYRDKVWWINDDDAGA